MPCFKPSVFFALSTLIIVLFAFSGTAEKGVVSRSVLEENKNGTSFVLAKERTRRKDPLDKSHYYLGGWNITNEHYFASALYSGAPLFGVAIIWFLAFGAFLLLSCCYVCCCRRRRYGYSRFAYVISLILLSLFTIAAIIGAIVLYTGQAKFDDSTKDTLSYVLKQADYTVHNLKNVTSYLNAAKNIGVGQVKLPQKVQKNIHSVNSMMSTAADTLDRMTKDNKNVIFRYLNAVGRFLIIVASVMLALALLGFLLSISGLQCIVYILVVVGWILVAITFILCAVFLVLHNVMGDTCVAMNDWVNNPTANTALDEIIPCVNKTTAQKALNASKEVTFEMVQLVNGIIGNVSNLDLPPNAAPLYYNQSGPLVPLLCNPYNSDKTDHKICSPGEVDLANATQVWKKYECQVSNNVCTTVGRLTPSLYDQMNVAVNVSYVLNQYGPFLTDLVDCSFVRDTFSTIHDQNCPDLTRYSKLVYVGLLMVSAAVMLSLILWVLYARERRHRKYTKLVDSASAQPSFER